MNNIHSPIALKKGDELKIRSWDTPAPKLKDFSAPTESTFERDDVSGFLKAHKQWQQSYKEHAVREADKEAFEQLIKEYHSKIKLFNPSEFFDDDFSKGIPCDFLKERLELKRIEGMGISYTEDSKDMFVSWPMEWILKPLNFEKMEEKEKITLSRTSFNYEADPKVEELLKCVQEKTIDLTKKLVEHKEKIIKEVARGELGHELTPEDYPDFSLKRIERADCSPMVDNWYEEIWYKKKLLGTIVYNFGIGPLNSKLMESTMEVKFIPSKNENNK